MDELGPSAKHVLDRARAARTPSAADRERLRAAIAASVAAGATTAVAASAKAWYAAAWVKVVLGASVAVIAGGGALIAWTASEPRTPAPTIARVEASVERSDEIAIEYHDEIAIDPITPTIEPPVPAASTPSAEAPREAEVATTPVRRPRPEPEGDLAAELELLHAAQRAWRSGDASGTLALVHDHETRFRRSQLASERTALRILALCRLGRDDEARRLAARWLRTATSSPSRRSVEESCAGH
jgi:RNA polymerase sigma-70 factor (ECF subfamily)